MVKLEDYTISELKQMVGSFNKIVKFGGYSKMKKAELIGMIRKKLQVEEGTNAIKLSIIPTDFQKLKKLKPEPIACDDSNLVCIYDKHDDDDDDDDDNETESDDNESLSEYLPESESETESDNTESE
tara:strand:- start:74 stop:454 length:381 start_codon:yes stop_codon:yes gene_type:complete